MRKIAEQKALEAYPEIEGSKTYFDRDYICTKFIDLNRQRREVYIKGYDEAMQDFLEKTEKFLYFQLNNGSIECGNIERLINDFKNYIENESKD